MSKCRMCSQETFARGRICQECEWEAESARAWAEAREAQKKTASAAVGVPATTMLPAVEDAADAATQPLPQTSAARAPDILRGAADTSYNLWRTRRGAALLLAIAASIALVGFTGLNPTLRPERAQRSVMDSEPGMLRHCSNAGPESPCLPSPPR